MKTIKAAIAVLGLAVGLTLMGATAAHATDEPVKEDYGYSLGLWVQDDVLVLFPQTLVTNEDQPEPDINGLDAEAQAYTDASGTRQCFQADLYKDSPITAALYAVGHLYGAENPDEDWPGDGSYKSEYSKVWCLDPTPPVVVEPPVEEPPVVVDPPADPPAEEPACGTEGTLACTGASEDMVKALSIGGSLLMVAGALMQIRRRRA